MLKITCYKCHWSWSLNREATEATLAALKPGEEYAALECPRCRRVNKVAVAQLKRSLPRVEPTEQEPSQDQS